MATAFARIDEQGVLVKYPYLPADFAADFPEAAARRDWDCPGIAGLGIVPVADADAPDAAPGTVVVEAPPVPVNGAWTRQWAARAMTADETEAYRAARIAEAKTLRDAKASADIATPKGAVAADAASVQKINGAVTMAMLSLSASEPYSVNWTMADGTRVAHDAAEIIAMGKAVALFVGACFDTSAELEDAIAAAADAAGIGAIDIDGAAWPG